MLDGYQLEVIAYHDDDYGLVCRSCFEGDDGRTMGNKHGEFIGWEIPSDVLTALWHQGRALPEGVHPLIRYTVNEQYAYWDDDLDDAVDPTCDVCDKEIS